VKISRMKTTLSRGTVLLALMGALGLSREALADVAPAADASSKEASAAPLSLLDAIRSTLRLQPAIQSANADLRLRTAEVDVARAPFDTLITTTASHLHDATPLPPGQSVENSLTTDTTDLSVGAAMTTTWGTTINPTVGLSRVHQRLSPNVPGLIDPAQRAHVGLTVTQPLLRGAGTVGAASAIAAARLARDAAVHSADRTAQEQVYLTLVAYYELVAATQDLTLLRAIEVAARKVVDDTRALVEGQQRPKSDLRGVEGNLANRARQVIEAENSRKQALYQLELAMGLGAEGAPNLRATDGFPSPSTPTPDRDAIVKLASRDRSDLLAARKNVESAAAQLQGAERNTLPNLDLSASVGYAGGVDRDGVDAFFAAAGRNVPGLNAGVALSLELPVSNTAREADRDLKRAVHERASIAARDLERQLPVAVLGALEDLRLSQKALESSTEAVKQYGQAVTDQRDRLREGAGTVMDLVFTEQLLITAEQSRTANQLRCATALARVFLAMGALPTSEGAVASTMGRLLGTGGSNGGQ
jgi:outer membrane protein TolC